jgi:hypothetical protein
MLGQGLTEHWQCLQLQLDAMGCFSIVERLELQLPGMALIYFLLARPQ